jgi:transposase
MELTMSEKELDRAIVLRSVLDRRLSKAKAAATLNLSERQVYRLLTKLQSQGAGGLISIKRNKRSNRAISDSIRAKALELVDTHYQDYGATLITEKLYERHKIKIGKETMRQWLIQTGRRGAKLIKPVKIRQLRARRDCFGELIQIDGSIHDWFEGRGEICTLLVFIDDATSRLVNLMFVPAETTLSYFAALNEYISEYGKPRAIYTDKHAVFKVNTPGGWNTNGLTQFGRAIKQLNIEAIFAHSPEAKGRVERANNTLQDRLVKELRFFGISTIAEANKFLKQYINEYNRKFAVEPKNQVDLHQTLTHRERFMLDRILSIQTKRRTNKNLIIKHHNVSYQLTNVGKGHRYINQNVVVCEKPDGDVAITWRGKSLSYSIYGEALYKPRFANRRDVDNAVNKFHFLMHNNISNNQGTTNHDTN